MAHFSKLTENTNEVLGVVVVDNNDILKNGVEDEATGKTFLENAVNWPANLWVKTSYNTKYNQHKEGGTPFRGNFATIGYTWDSENQIFWPPKPYPSWVKNIAEARWQSPIGDHPNFKSITSPEDIWPDNVDNSEMLTPNGDGNSYEWNETTLSWDIA